MLRVNAPWLRTYCAASLVAPVRCRASCAVCPTWSPATSVGAFTSIARRWASATPPGDAVASASVAESGARAAAVELSSVAEVSDADKQLLRDAFFAPEKQKRAANPLGGVGAGIATGDMAAVFTCDICKLRSVKRFNKASYEHGIVVVQCGGCGSKHLLADHLGWFDEKHKTIEDVLRERGDAVLRLAGSIHIDRLDGAAAQGAPQNEPAAQASQPS